MTRLIPRVPVGVAVAFALVSFFWGSTFLAIGIGVKDVPPALMSGLRFLVAGLIMLASRIAVGARVIVSRRDFVRLAIAAVLLLSLGNVLLTWAERTVPTGIAALLATTIPLWILVIDSWILGGDRVSSIGYAGFALGVVGVAVLMWPRVAGAGALGARELAGCLGVLASSLSWAIGSIVARRWPASVPAFTAIGWQMLVAGCVNLTVAIALGDLPHAQWTWRAIGAIGYLAVFGSLVGFSAYIWLLAHVPVAKAGTYAYVNPVIAVLLGWLVLDEKVDAYVACGSCIILAAVAMATHARAPRPAVPQPVRRVAAL